MRTPPTSFPRNADATRCHFPRLHWLKKFGVQGGAIAAALAILVTAGCTSHAPPSKIMQSAPAAVGTPPAGKSLVLIYFPSSMLGDHSGVWDSTNFVADMSGGNAVEHVCEPGQHYFINRSVENVGVVEARLLPGQTYGLFLSQHLGWVGSSIQIEPIKRGTSEWKKAPAWQKDAIWVARAPAAADHEALRQPYIEGILKDFVTGEKKDRIRHLDPEDHR